MLVLAEVQLHVAALLVGVGLCGRSLGGSLGSVGHRRADVGERPAVPALVRDELGGVRATLADVRVALASRGEARARAGSARARLAVAPGKGVCALRKRPAAAAVLLAKVPVAHARARLRIAPARAAVARRVLGPHVVLLVRHAPANHRGGRSLALGDPPLPLLPTFFPPAAAAAVVLGVALVLRPHRLLLTLAAEVGTEAGVHLRARGSIHGAGDGARVPVLAVHAAHLDVVRLVKGRPARCLVRSRDIAFVRGAIVQKVNLHLGGGGPPFSPLAPPGFSRRAPRDALRRRRRPRLLRSRRSGLAGLALDPRRVEANRGAGVGVVVSRRRRDEPTPRTARGLGERGRVPSAGGASRGCCRYGGGSLLRLLRRAF